MLSLSALTLVHDLLIRDGRRDLAASETTQTCLAECMLERRAYSVYTGSFALFSIADEAEGAGYIPTCPSGPGKVIAHALIAQLDLLAFQPASSGTFGYSHRWSRTVTRTPRVLDRRNLPDLSDFVSREWIPVLRGRCIKHDARPCQRAAGCDVYCARTDLCGPKQSIALTPTKAQSPGNGDKDTQCRDRNDGAEQNCGVRCR